MNRNYLNSGGPTEKKEKKGRKGKEGKDRGGEEKGHYELIPSQTSLGRAEPGVWSIVMS